jgi:hypothetical protein
VIAKAWRAFNSYVSNAAKQAKRPEVALAAVASVLLPFGLLEPIFTVVPSLGDPLLDAGWEEVTPGATLPHSFSVLGGIAKLYEGQSNFGDSVVATVLLLFSVFFPAVKLVLTWRLLAEIGSDPARSDAMQLSIQQKSLRRLEAVGPWSMADVFVISVMLLAFKSFPGATTFTIESGYYLFLLCVVSSLASVWIAISKVHSAVRQRP